MPNTLISVFVSNPATEPVEAPHPNTGVYVTGTQATTGGPWTVTHTLVTKTTTPLTMVGRLKNYPAVTVAVVATGGPNAGNIFNNVLATPTVGPSNASGTSTTSINVTVSSIANQTAYRLLASDTSAGTYTQIYQGTTASFPHTGLTAGQTKYYKWQYVGGGYYDDSTLSAVFSGVTSAAGAGIGGVAATDAVVVFISGQSNAQGNAEATEVSFAPMDTFSPNIGQSFATVKIWNVATGVFESMVVGTNTRSDYTNTYPQGYTYAAKADGTWDVGNAAAKYNITGVGPEYGLADAWKAAGTAAGTAVPLYIIKFAQGGTSINEWQKTNPTGTLGLYAKLLAHKQNAFAALTAAGKNIRVLGFFRNQGEADATMSQTTYQTALTQLYADLNTDTFFTSETKLVEVATPTTNDTGTPVTYGAELAAKQAFAALAPASRFVLDAAAVALEHDEIHWNLATQYNYGFVRLSNIFFASGLALPATVTPPAPTLAFNSTSGVVTVTAPGAVGAWPQKEFYYTLNGSAPKRLTTTFTFLIPTGVTANAGQVQVYARAVPGRAQSPAASNPAAWVGPSVAAVAGPISWLTASGVNTAQSGSGTTTTLYRSGGTNGWNAYAPGSLKIMAPAVGFVGEVARLVVPNVPAVNSAIVLGVSKSASIVTKDNIYVGIYVDPASYGLMNPIAGSPGNFAGGGGTAGSIAYTTSTGQLTMVIYDNRTELYVGNVLRATLSEPPFSGTTALWVQGITYGLAGWSAGQQVSQIVGATVTGTTLVAF